MCRLRKRSSPQVNGCCTISRGLVPIPYLPSLVSEQYTSWPLYPLLHDTRPSSQYRRTVAAIVIVKLYLDSGFSILVIYLLRQISRHSCISHVVRAYEAAIGHS